MKIDIVTIFPQIFIPYIEEGMVRIALEKKVLKIALHDLRDYTDNKHRQVDDSPYGGGPGMVMQIEPFYNAVTSILDCHPEQIKDMAKVVMLSPQGRTLNMDLLKELSIEKRLVLLCGRYEGVDERVSENLATTEISIGDYVLSGGEVPAMVLIEGISRLLPGVLGDDDSASRDSFSNGLLEYPHYTRPADFKGWKVPEVLLSGNHQQIAEWRKEQSIKKTKSRRPDLLTRD